MKISLIILVFICIGDSLYGQLPANATGKPFLLGDPERTLYPKEETIRKIAVSDDFEPGETFWYVYSDRSDNITYTGPNGAVSGKLDFMERANVAETSGGWAHIYREESVMRFPYISRNAVDLGWIKMDKLLLNDYALANKNNFARKGMVLVDLTKPSPVVGTTSFNQFYSSPDLKKGNGNFAKTLEIYFILKTSDNSVLLAKADKVKGSSEESRGNVMGWMPKTNITFWDHRVCLELNWRQDAFNEFGKQPVAVFLEKEQARNFMYDSDTAKSIRTRLLTGKRDDGYTPRSPVIDIDGPLKKVGTIGHISKVKEETISILRSRLQDVKDKIENINILFAIDGTQSMKNFTNPVASSIAASIIKLKAKDSKNRLKFGVVVYRDYADESKCVEIKKITSDYNDVITFLKTSECNSKDKDVPEAVYNGLAEGLMNGGFRKNESNFLIVIGDAGNHNPDPRQRNMDEVLALMHKYQCSMVGFQVNNGYDESYDNFIDMTRDLLIKTATTLTGSGDNNQRVKWEQVNNNSYKINILNSKTAGKEDDLLMVGRYTFSEKGGSMPVTWLEADIEKTIDEYDNRVNGLKAMLESSINRVGGQFSDEFFIWLKNQGFSSEDLENLVNVGGIHVEGWTTDKLTGRQNPPYLPVAFMSQNEFREMIRACDKINEDMQTFSERRSNLQRSLIQKCKSILGAENGEAMITQMNLDEVWHMILGVPFYDKIIGKIRIRDIADPSVFEESEMNQFIDRFKSRLDLLRPFLSTKYPYSFESNDIKFYWIPLEDMP